MGCYQARDKTSQRLEASVIREHSFIPPGSGPKGRWVIRCQVLDKNHPFLPEHLIGDYDYLGYSAIDSRLKKKIIEHFFWINEIGPEGIGIHDAAIAWWVNEAKAKHALGVLAKHKKWGKIFRMKEHGPAEVVRFTAQ